MIVKNEAENLPACIHSIKSAVDEIVAVDTGSTDLTQERAKQLGAKVFDFQWCDDFSAARNESIKHATGDYILWLDADDRVDASEVEKIRQLKKLLPQEKNKAYYMVVNNQSPVDGETLFHQMRVFPNRKGAMFEGRIHEQIFHVLGRMGIESVQTDIVIRHTGYHDPRVIQKKSERNLKIIEKELESDPNNLILHYNAARTLSGINRSGEAIGHMKQIIEDEKIRKNEKQFFFEAALLLGKYYADVHQYDQAISIYKDLSKNFEEKGLVHYCLGQTLFFIKDYEGAREALQKSLLLPIEVSLFPVNLGHLCYYQHYTLGQCYLETGKPHLAREMFLKSVNLHMDHHKSFQALGFLSLKDQQFEEAVGYYEKAIQEGGVTDSNYSNLGLAYRKLGFWKEAENALLKAWEINPKRVEALTNLGHLYHKKKEFQKGMYHFTKALEIDPNLTDVRLALSDIYFRLYDIENLVGECDALLKELTLPRNLTLNNFEELSGLYNEIGETLAEERRYDLALMAYQVSFLISPSKGVLEKVVSMSTSLGLGKAFLSEMRDALELHGAQSQRMRLS